MREPYGSLIKVVRKTIRNWPGETFTARDIATAVHGRKFTSTVGTVHLLHAYGEVEIVEHYPRVYRATP